MHRLLQGGNVSAAPTLATCHLTSMGWGTLPVPCRRAKRKFCGCSCLGTTDHGRRPLCCPWLSWRRIQSGEHPPDLRWELSHRARAFRIAQCYTSVVCCISRHCARVARGACSLCPSQAIPGSSVLGLRVKAGGHPLGRRWQKGCFSRSTTKMRFWRQVGWPRMQIVTEERCSDLAPGARLLVYERPVPGLGVEILHRQFVVDGPIQREADQFGVTVRHEVVRTEGLVRPLEPVR